MERRLPAAVLVAYAVFAAFVVVEVELHGPLSQHLAAACFLVPELAGILLTRRAAFHRRLTPSDRRSWRLVCGAVVAHTASALLIGGSLYSDTPVGPFLITGVTARVLFVGLLLAGLLSFATTPLTWPARVKLAMDASTVVGGGLMVLWYFIFGPILIGGQSDTDGAAGLSYAIYPMLDLVLLVGVGTVLLRGVSATARRSVQLLLIGTLVYLIEDLYVTWWSLDHSMLHVGASISASLLGAPPFLLAAAAAEQCRQASAPEEEQRRQRPLRPFNGLPYVALVLGFGLMAGAALRAGRYPWPGLVAGSVVMTGAVALRQITALRENHLLVVTDSLTGLANRVLLRERLQLAFDQATRTGRTMAVLQIDLNGFKQVNDTLGHEAGDLVLVAFARALARSVRESETAARLGGDEFAVILDDVGDGDAAALVAERILAAVQEEKVVVGGHRIPIRASIGIALSGPDCAEPAELLHRADIAMYLAKRKRSHGWELYDTITQGGQESDDAHLIDRQMLGEELADALAAGELHLVYQPIVALNSGRLTAVEALARWQHPTRGPLPPDTFIPIAEEIGLIDRLGNWVLEEACRQVRQWQAGLPPGRTLHLSVNCSPLHVDRGSLAADVLEILRRNGFPPEHLVLEITENTRLDEEVAIPQLVLLRSHGIRIALDDFGTGYSSLRHLARLPVDILKLDKFFVAELNGAPETAAVAEAVIRLGEAMKLDTVAEGIEAPGQAAELTRLGFAHGQGYHFARPLEPEALGRLITAELADAPVASATSLHSPARGSDAG
jgi:diguanylate cyclase (GGDEF)-like protein